MYYSYVHSVISYGIIFWDNSHLSDSIFKIQKKDNKNYYKFW